MKFSVWQGGRRWAGGIDRLDRLSKLWVRRGWRPVFRQQNKPGMTAAVAGIVAALRRLGLRPDVVVHRIVHGGQVFDRLTRLTPAVKRRLRTLIPLAPLHQPAQLAVVAAAGRAWPEAQQYAVFDTALYRHLPPAAATYALPLRLTRRFGIRKYGFHGISHAWAAQHAARRLGQPLARLNLVTIHLGSGDSMTRWVHGRPVDTSMGFSPTEGLTMATRSGDLDPLIPLFLQTQAGLSVGQVATILEQRSGLFGLSGLRDMRDVLGAAGHPVRAWPRRRWTATERRHARLALDVFCYDVSRYLAAYLGLSARTDVVVFTGTIGRNAYLRRRILAGTPAARRVRRLTIPADEEAAIAQAAWRVIH